MLKSVKRISFSFAKIIEKPSLDNNISLILSRQSYFFKVKHESVNSEEEFYINGNLVKPFLVSSPGIIKLSMALLPVELLRDGPNDIRIKFSKEAPRDIDVRINNFRKKVSKDIYIFRSDIPNPYASGKPAASEALFLLILFYGLSLILIKPLFPGEKTNILAVHSLLVSPAALLFFFMALIPRFSGYRIMISSFIFWLILLSLFLILLTISLLRSYRRLLIKRSKVINIMPNLMASFLSLIVLLCIAEVITRIYASHFYKDRIFELANPNLSYKLKPNAKGLFAGAYVKCNSLGLREDKELAYKAGTKKPDGTTTIVCLGDSITFGYGVANNEPYPAVLSNILDKQGKRKCEVINCGVSAYNINQERLFLRDYGIKFNPDIIIVGVCLGDIGRGLSFPSGIVNTFITPFYSGPRYRLYRYEDMPLICKAQFIILRHSWFAQYVFLKFKALCSRMKWFKPSMVGDYSVDSLNYFSGFWNGNRSKEESLFEDDVVSINKLAEEKNAKLLVAVFPNDIQLDKENLRFPQRSIGDFCRQRNIYFLDLLPYFKAHDKKDVFIDIGHPSPLGHKIAAEAIGNFITQQILGHKNRITP